MEDAAPIPEARITVDGVPLVATTDSAGRFQIGGVPPGEHTVRAAAIGHRPTSAPVRVEPGGSAAVALQLPALEAALPEVTVIGSRSDLSETRARLRLVPGSVALVEPEQIRASKQANLKDALRLVPGVYLQPRQGAADESQISIRGSGLRNNFHARGVNLLVNGMPYRNADGFTDFESLELLAAEAIHVYKGGNALRYGGSTLGGAINVETRTGHTAEPIQLFAETGSHGFLKAQVSSGGVRGPFNYYASYARTVLDGHREWSDQRRDRVNAHVGYRLSPSTDARAFYLFARVDEHLPGALTRDELRRSPRAANPENVAGRWGREYDLHHLGVQLRTQLGAAHRLEISPYFQYRDIDHPIFQVIAQVSRDYGAEVRYENTAPLAGRANRLTLGFQPAYLDMDHRRYVNEAGEHGALRKDQKDEASSLAFYAEDVLDLTSRLSLVLGLRYDRSVRKSRDFHQADGDQSDRRVFSALLPKTGLLYRLGEQSQLYANVSRSYEPPLLLELNSLAVPGFIPLEGQDAWQFELGTRGRAGALLWDVSAYDVELRDELLIENVRPFPDAPFTVPSYRNADRTRHYGLEAGLSWAFATGLLDDGDGLSARLSYTFGRYAFTRDSLYDGREIPGLPPHLLAGEFRYAHPSGLSLAPSLEWAPVAYYVNSENTAKNRGWLTLGCRAEWHLAPAGLTVFAAGENLAGRVSSPSVQVNDAAGRYYEPADGRSFYVGARWER